MEIRRLVASDYDELLSVLNKSFAAVRNRPVDFLRGQPKMWGRDDLHMGRHLGIFLDGRLVSCVGIYPLTLCVGEKKLHFATTGNVATLPEYAGRGYFSKLFSLAMQEAEREGYDALRLGGQKQRYVRFGFEDAGALYQASFSEKNRSAVCESAYASVSFERLTENSLSDLIYIRELTSKAPCYVERYPTEGERDVYLVLHSKYSEAYIAKRGGAPIGYLCCADEGKNITELRAQLSEDFTNILAAWQAKMQATVTVPIAPWMQDELFSMSCLADCITVQASTKIKLLKPERVIDAFLSLKHKMSPLPSGEFTLKIKDLCAVRLCVDAENAYCKRVEEGSADLALDAPSATKLLFGNFPVELFGSLPACARAWLPLPLCWNFLDLV